MENIIVMDIIIKLDSHITSSSVLLAFEEIYQSKLLEMLKVLDATKKME